MAVNRVPEAFLVEVSKNFGVKQDAAPLHRSTDSRQAIFLPRESAGQGWVGGVTKTAGYVDIDMFPLWPPRCRRRVVAAVFSGFPGKPVRNPSCSGFVWIFCLQTDLRLRRRYNPQGWGLYAEDPNILVSTPAKLSGNG